MDTETKPPGEKPPKKKRHILRWIFNILCLLIVSLLFLIGAWTRNLHWFWLLVPIALWVAAFKRKLAGWLAMAFLATIIGIVIWLFLPESGNWRPYNFDYELKDLEAKRAVPDAENAAIAYQKIIVRLDVNNAPPFYDKDCNGPSTSIPWKGSEHPQTAAFLDARQNIITDAMAASMMEKCAFPAPTSPLNLPLSLNILSGMYQTPYLLMSVANRDMGEGRIDEAFEKYGCVVRMGRQIEQQPTLTYFLFGLAIENFGASRISSAIVTADLTHEQLNNIRQMLPATDDDWPKLWSTMSEYEKMFGKNLFGLMCYEINDAGTVRFRRNPMPFPKELMQSFPSPTILHQKLTKLSTIGDWFAYPHNPKDFSKIYDEEFERAEKLYDVNRPESENKPDFKSCFKLWAKNPHRGIIFMMAQITAPVHFKVHELYLRTIVYRRTMYILIALREYKNANGRWPDNRDQIKDKVPAEVMIDPFTGGSFIYKTKGDKFLLYSVGENKIDEKCAPRPKIASPTPEALMKQMQVFDDILIWPQKYEQAKEFFDANTSTAK